jgi:hypothetical protein
MAYMLKRLDSFRLLLDDAKNAAIRRPALEPPQRVACRAR